MCTYKVPASICHLTWELFALAAGSQLSHPTNSRWRSQWKTAELVTPQGMKSFPYWLWKSLSTRTSVGGWQRVAHSCYREEGGMTGNVIHQKYESGIFYPWSCIREVFASLLTTARHLQMNMLGMAVGCSQTPPPCLAGMVCPSRCQPQSTFSLPVEMKRASRRQQRRRREELNVELVSTFCRFEDVFISRRSSWRNQSY